MEERNIIRIREICSQYQVREEFIIRLHDFGLIELITRDEEQFMESESLSELETLMHLHYDLEINMEGIDAISHLLKRVKEVQRELTLLRNRLP